MGIESHVMLMVLFAGAVSVVGATLLKDDVREQVRTGSALFGALVGGAVLIGWILYLFPL